MGTPARSAIRARLFLAVVLGPTQAECTFDATGRGHSGAVSSDTTTGGAECGNAEVEATEECDDGNSDISDGCLPDCQRAGSCEAIKGFDSEAETGVYTLSPDGNSFEVYCEMEIDGGGWQLLSVRHDTSGVLFASEDCLGVDLNCSSYIRASQIASDPPEVLIATLDAEYWLRISGLEPPGSDGLADVLNLQRPLGSQDTCAYPHHCGPALDAELMISASSSSWTPRFSTLPAQFLRQGGIWLGDGGGNPPNHVVSMNYGAFCSSAGGLDLSDNRDSSLGNVVCGVPGAMYFR